MNAVNFGASSVLHGVMIVWTDALLLLFHCVRTPCSPVEGSVLLLLFFNG